MAKARRLTDLYVVGKEVTLNDGAGDPIKVWVQKLNPVDHEAAVRRSGALRSRVLSLHAGDENPMVEEIRSDAYDLGEDGLVEYLITEDLGKKRMAVEGEFAAEEEWSKNDYLQGLRDAWVDTLAQRYAENSGDEEANSCLDELKRFAAAVNASVDSHAEAMRRDYSDKSLEQLIEQAVERMLQVRADMAWLSEYRKCEIWLSVRDHANHNEKYFTSREEVDQLTQEVVLILATAYREITLDGTEGKDSEETPSSSQSSEQPAEGETAASSGQGDVAA